MKIKPYRVCDICKKQYAKGHNCMKVKILEDRMGYIAGGEQLAIMDKLDICPDCASKMIKWILEQGGKHD